MAKVIAIDGPSGAGKSSVSRLVGERLGFLHVDSGALYRIMTWQALAHGVATADPAAVAAFAAEVAIDCRPEDGRITWNCYQDMSPATASARPRSTRTRAKSRPSRPCATA